MDQEKEGTALYQALPAEAQESLEEVTSLEAGPENRLESFPDYETWQSRKDR